MPSRCCTSNWLGPSFKTCPKCVGQQTCLIQPSSRKKQAKKEYHVRQHTAKIIWLGFCCFESVSHETASRTLAATQTSAKKCYGYGYKPWYPGERIESSRDKSLLKNVPLHPFPSPKTIWTKQWDAYSRYSDQFSPQFNCYRSDLLELVELQVHLKPPRLSSFELPK